MSLRRLYYLSVRRKHRQTCITGTACISTRVLWQPAHMCVYKS